MSSSSTVTTSLAYNADPHGLPGTDGCAHRSRSGTSAAGPQPWRRTGSPWPRPDAGVPLGGAARIHRRAWPASAFWEWAAAGPPPARADAPACGSPSSPRTASRSTPSSDPSGCARLRSPGAVASPWPPRYRQPCRRAAACCGVGPPP